MYEFAIATVMMLSLLSRTTFFYEQQRDFTRQYYITTNRVHTAGNLVLTTLSRHLYVTVEALRDIMYLLQRIRH